VPYIHISYKPQRSEDGSEPRYLRVLGWTGDETFIHTELDSGRTLVCSPDTAEFDADDDMDFAEASEEELASCPGHE
jgi:hypothetical protein